MNKYGLHGKIIASEGNTEKLTEILLKAADLMKKTEGCHLYIVSKDEAHKNTVWITEVWDNIEAHDEALNIEGARELIGQAIPIVDGPPQRGQEFTVLGGAGIE